MRKKIINSNDWSVVESKKSPEYIERIEEKSQYVIDIKHRILPFALGDYETLTK